MAYRKTYGRVAAAYAGRAISKYFGGKRKSGGATKRRGAKRARVATRAPRGRTYTATKRGSPGRIIRCPPSGLSHSYCSYGRGKYKSQMKAMSQPFTYQQLASNGVTTFGASNVQAYGLVSGAWTGADMIGRLQQSLQFVIGAVSTGPQFETGQRSFKLGLDYQMTRSWFTNQEGTPCTMIIYDCISKKDCSGSVYDVNSVWFQGYTDQTKDLAGGASLGPGYPGSVPHNSKQFLQYWKIVGTTKVELGPGRSHEHVFRHTVNKVKDTAELAVETGTSQNLRGLTHQQMVVVLGVPTDSSATNAIGTVAFTPCKVVWVVQNKQVTRVVSSTPRGTISVTGLSSSVLPHFVSEGSGLVNSVEEVA